MATGFLTALLLIAMSEYTMKLVVSTRLPITIAVDTNMIVGLQAYCCGHFLRSLLAFPRTVVSSTHWSSFRIHTHF
jgi:hypothetical protein